MSARLSYSRAERALRLRQPRDAAVEAVEHHGDEDRDRGLVEALVHRLHDRVEAGRTAPPVVNRLGSR